MQFLKILSKCVDHRKILVFKRSQRKDVLFNTQKKTTTTTTQTRTTIKSLTNLITVKHRITMANIVPVHPTSTTPTFLQSFIRKGK